MSTAVATVSMPEETNDDNTSEYECSECLGSYRQDVEENDGAELVRCGYG